MSQELSDRKSRTAVRAKNERSVDAVRPPEGLAAILLTLRMLRDKNGLSLSLTTTKEYPP